MDPVFMTQLPLSGTSCSLAHCSESVIFSVLSLGCSLNSPELLLFGLVSAPIMKWRG